MPEDFPEKNNPPVRSTECSASRAESDKTMLSGVILCIVGWLMDEFSMNVAGAFIVAACGFINSMDRRRRKTPNNVLDKSPENHE